jgi:pyruvate dehydrogenase E2 component (dihydrolipoamide acetyltransferase)
MPTDVVMPQMGESITEGTITKWLKKVGEAVQRDEPLFEISTDKVDAEIPSPTAGILKEIKIAEGTTVEINTVVCSIEEAGTASAPAAAPASVAETAATPANDSTTPAAIDSPATDDLAAAAAGTGTEVLMPQMGESITEGTITKWLKKVGDTVQRDEPIFEISTDKVDAEIPSPVAGKLTEIKVPEGSTVTINTVVAVIGGGAAAPAAKPAAAAPAPVAAAPAAPASAQASEGGRIVSSPLVRKIASDNNVNLADLSGTGTSGRITKADIVGHLESGAKPAPVAAAPAAPAPAAKPAAAVATPQPGELVPMTKMRAIIAKRMVESKHTSPHVHTIFKVDMTRIVKLREREKNKYEQRNGTKLTYMPFITRAAINALRKHPVVNAAIQGDAILYNRSINIGIAVALDWGLIVPVIKGTEEKNFLGVARSIVDLAERARNKKLAPDEVSGGTFTITNAGIFGEQFGTPIINQPQAAILGVGGLNKEALVLTDKDGQDTIAIRNVQRFTLGFDHRIVDGADAGKFMSDFKAYLENWSEDIG